MGLPDPLLCQQISWPGGLKARNCGLPASQDQFLISFPEKIVASISTCRRLDWSEQSRLEGLQARAQAEKNSRSLEPDPAQTLHPPDVDRCTKTDTKAGAQSEFKRTLSPSRSKQGCRASGGGLMQVRVRACVFQQPHTPSLRNLKP